MLKQIPIDLIRTRREVKARLIDVPDSYKEQCINDGAILEPSFCRKLDTSPNRFELMSNARPWLTAQICQYHVIPAFVLTQDYDNYQPYAEGTSMNAIEVAELNCKLKDELNLSVTDLAQHLGANRSALAHSLRLLKLIDPIKDKVKTGDVSASFARRLAGFDHPTQKQLFEQFSASDSPLSIRALEKALRDIRNDAPAKSVEKPLPAAKTADIVRLERLMTENIGSTVELHQDHLSINFGGNLDVLDGILEKFGIQIS